MIPQSLHWLIEGGLLIALIVCLLRLRRLRVAAPVADAATTDPSSRSDTYIAIRILNPMELARRQSWLAGTLAGISPNFVRRLVHTRTVQILKEQLLDYGVDADVRLEQGRPGPGLPLKADLPGSSGDRG
ncbi:hypothetical protein [uncultured Abyssibacter sp.]|uniref:hypothetical protein n=1 Tax=uncultured Abyssibacter sp. TaxID=2320202 RepID=UPI0032B1731C